METPKLGELVTGTAARDAIHVAVAPVTAGHRLKPGQHVGLDEAGRSQPMLNSVGCKTVGIVDPFLLKDWVEEGERHWLCLYPGSVTSLRHVWVSPHFKTRAPKVSP